MLAGRRGGRGHRAGAVTPVLGEEDQVLLPGVRHDVVLERLEQGDGARGDRVVRGSHGEFAAAGDDDQQLGLVVPLVCRGDTRRDTAPGGAGAQPVDRAHVDPERRGERGGVKTVNDHAVSFSSSPSSRSAAAAAIAGASR